MKRTLFRALIGIIFIPSLSLIKPANSNPYNQYYPYQNRNNYQRSQGWSDGDFFGTPPSRRRQSSYDDYSRPSNYQPGLNNNIRYRQNDCAIYINC